MKARKRGTDAPFDEIEYVQLRDSYVITKADQMEFENESKNSEASDGVDYWEKLRHQAAIAAMQGILIGSHDKITAESLEVISHNAAFFADALVIQLRNE